MLKSIENEPKFREKEREIDQKTVNDAQSKKEKKTRREYCMG